MRLSKFCNFNNIEIKDIMINSNILVIQRIFIPFLSNLQSIFDKYNPEYKNIITFFPKHNHNYNRKFLNLIKLYSEILSNPSLDFL